MIPAKLYADEQEWLEGRRLGIGGSDAPAILGVDSWKSILDVYADKIGIPPSKEAGEPARWGKRLEAVLADAYVEESGRELVNHGLHVFQNKERPWQLATLDREIVNVKDKPGPGVYESKCTSFRVHNEKEIREDLPVNFQIQVQHYLAVTDLEWGSIAILLDGNRLLWQDVARDDAFIKALNQQESEFWERVQNREPPPPESTETASRALRRLYAKSVNDIVELPIEAFEWDRRLVKAKEEIKHWEAEETAMGNLIKAALGEKEFGLLPDKVTTYSWKSSPRAGFTVEPTTVRPLRRLKPKGVK